MDTMTDQMIVETLIGAVMPLAIAVVQRWRVQQPHWPRAR